MSNKHRLPLPLFALLAGGISMSASADSINMGVSFAIPPYVIQQNNSGLELEILKHALARRGHMTVVHYLPLARTFRELKEGQLDGIINTQPHMLDGVYYSDEVIRFHNCVFTLASRDLSITSLADLKGKSVVAFQKASKLLGTEFGTIVAQQPSYNEVATQKQQLFLLFKGRVDAIILERSIFGYYRKQEVDDGFKAALAQVKEHCIFPPTDYRFAFRSEQIRDDFNAGLKEITDDGTLHALQLKYRDMMELPTEY
ncbi:substrate-binding periplasmic protein [Shewanella sp.]|uniref:substrate-binding periplasmic protein n=1 Tax=Shewanella sp. TaxID=50422 RepID=UPI0035686024